MASPGWPADWARRVAGEGCVMCAALGGGDNEHWVHVADCERAEVYLERRTRVRGYCIVVWRHGHVAEPMDLEPEAADAYWRSVMEVARAVRTVFEPVKLNLLTLGNTVPHLHTHVVPRYRDDPAPGAPLAWDQIVAAEPVAEAELRGQAIELRRVLG